MQGGSIGFLARPERSSVLLFGGTFHLHGRGVYAHLFSRSDYYVFFQEFEACDRPQITRAADLRELGVDVELVGVRHPRLLAVAPAYGFRGTLLM